ncbi:ABC transporter ATP-binding protein [Saccharospirillum mangrovi]|uniref:ABC transporter ATP-binding protein n=1 Tax=Saccharospirillum mangrovi TaxID=2161747 RepID=UPI000D33C1EC|nr:ABC transporter ATP-binding protein [Saccharospirillum mangrovi]
MTANTPPDSSSNLGQKTASRLAGQALTVGYDDVNILDGVDFEVPDGEVTILVGPNGSGKSTLLKTLARILSPRAGQVILDGQDIHRSKTREVAKKLGLLPQGPIAPEGLTVRELVGQGRFPHQSLLRQWSSEDERAVTAAMETARVSEFADRPVDGLSGGQRQRCWIAMVLAQQTDLILLDEPTTFLDLKVQVDLMDMLVRLAHETGRTLVVVLHELNLAAAYADRLVMLRDGRIEQSGTPEDIFTSANLKAVFDLDAHVIRDPHSQRLLCVPSSLGELSSRVDVGARIA